MEDGEEFEEEREGDLKDKEKGREERLRLHVDLQARVNVKKLRPAKRNESERRKVNEM